MHFQFCKAKEWISNTVSSHFLNFLLSFSKEQGWFETCIKTCGTKFRKEGFFHEYSQKRVNIERATSKNLMKILKSVQFEPVVLSRWGFHQCSCIDLGVKFAPKNLSMVWAQNLSCFWKTKPKHWSTLGKMDFS